MNKVQETVARVLVLVVLTVIASCSGSSDEKQKGKRQDNSKLASTQSAQQPGRQQQPIQSKRAGPIFASGRGNTGFRLSGILWRLPSLLCPRLIACRVVG